MVSAHEGILECAVVGVSCGRSGEKVKLFAVRKRREVNRQRSYSFLSQALTAYKVPKEVEFRNELPKTNVGKILRRALGKLRNSFL